MGQFQEVLDPRPRRVGDHFRGKRMFVFPAECCKLGLVLEICDIHKGKVAPTFPFLHWPLSCGRKCAVWFCDDEGQRLGQGWHANYCIQLVTSSITYVLVGWENIRLMCKRKNCYRAITLKKMFDVESSLCASFSWCFDKNSVAVRGCVWEKK